VVLIIIILLLVFGGWRFTRRWALSDGDR